LQPTSSDFYCPDLLLLKARRIQAFLQQQDFLIAFDASELLLGFQESCGPPAQVDFLLASVLRCVPRAVPSTARFDRVGGGQFPSQYRSDTQAMYG